MRGGGDVSYMAPSAGPGSLYSASDIANRYGSGMVSQAAASFPALPRPVDTATPAQIASVPNAANQKKSGKPEPIRTMTVFPSITVEYYPKHDCGGRLSKIQTHTNTP
jgi:hypothetical protein